MSETANVPTEEERRAALQSWLEAQRKMRTDSARKLSEMFFDGTEQEIPDLEFLPPDCPICYEPTEYDDGWFACHVCEVMWPQSGYGSKARSTETGLEYGSTPPCGESA